VLVSTIPETTTRSPLGSVVAVGYQRPAFMFGSRVQVFVDELYVEAIARPTLSETCPPTTISRPSASRENPVQKML